MANHCDRAKKRHPEACTLERSEARCECGKVFARCDAHGSLEGAIRSRAAHRGLGCSRVDEARSRLEGRAVP